MSAQLMLKRELGLRDLTLFAITCVISARWIPIAAHAGPGSVLLWLLAAMFFMAPLAVAVATLVAKYPEAGGLYLWTRRDFGAWPGFLCFWIYWIGIACLFPTAALLYVRVGFSMFGTWFAQLGDNRFVLLAATLVLIWLALGSNLIGLKIGKWTENIGALAAWVVALLLVVVAWMVWTRRGSATPMHILPKWNWGTVSFWAAIAYATSGMEGPGMMAGEIRHPERMMRRAGWIASGFATAFYVSATVAFLVVLSPDSISELNGFAQVGDSAGRMLRAAWLSPLMAFLVVVSGVGFVGGIGTAASRMPFAAGMDRLLPSAFSKVHPRWATPYVSILALGLVATFLLVVYQLGDTVRVAYDELVSLMVITGFVPYLYVFASAWKAGKHLSAASGAAVTLLALFCAVVPPSEITQVWLFEGKLAAGTLAVILSAWLIYRQRKHSSYASA
ncbi:MAG TPA: APC family permease [Candidatus Acidoferrales bacterium]|nr:APC family permease [Candidatus Acidoferrales bacterium]